MNKKVFWAIALLFVLIISACNNAKNEKINSVFKEYIQNNFDDPSQFVEVVSVETTDTFSTLVCKQAVNSLSVRVDSLRQLDKLLSKEFHFLVDKYGRRLRSIPGFDEAYEDYFRADDNERKFLEPYSISMQNGTFEEDFPYLRTAEEIGEMKDSVLYISNLKYRIKHHGEIKLENILCYSDTSNTYFFFGDFEEDSYVLQFSNIFRETCEYLKGESKVYSEMVRCREKMIRMIKDAMEK